MAAALAALAGFTALAIAMSQQGDAAFPGANGRIAFANGDAYQTSIWSANPDGSAPTQLTNGTNDNGPSYSADGNRIAFGRNEGIAVMNADGSGLAQLSTGTYNTSSDTEWQENYDDPHSEDVIPFVKIESFNEMWQNMGNPSFSPDGSQLAVNSSAGKYVFKSICAVEGPEETDCISYYEEEGAYFNYEFDCIGCASQIITINSVNGAFTGQVTPPSETVEDWDPSYGPGGRIAFTRWSSSSFDSRIFVVNAPGAPPVPLTNGPNDYSPDFSPDGSRVIFNHGNREFGLIGSSGGPVSILSVPLPPGATSGNVNSPAFSPDGSRVTFQRNAYAPGVGEVDSGIFTMGADGSGPMRIIDGGYDPNWQPLAVPPPVITPSKTKTKKGSTRLNRKKQAVIGTIACGSTPCQLKVISALLKVRTPKKKGGKKRKAKAHHSRKSKKGKRRNKTYKVKASVPRTLAPGAQAKVKVTVRGKALRALARAKKGRLTVKVQIIDGLGRRVTTLRSKLKPPKAKKKRGKKGKKRGHKKSRR